MAGSGISRPTFFVYEDNPVRQFRGGMKSATVDATKMWLKHYDNLLYLQFLDRFEGKEGRPPLTLPEKLRLGKELVMCQSKLDYWAKHPNYDNTEAIRGAEQRKSKWQTS